MAKKAVQTAPQAKLAGKTVAFVGKFGYADMWRQRYEASARAAGGKIVDIAGQVPDYLVVGEGRGGKPPGIVATVQKRHPAIQVLDGTAFNQLLAPSRDELLAELRAGVKENDHQHWDRFEEICRQAGTIDLSGSDLRKVTLYGAKLQSVNLDGVDLRNSSAHYAHLPNLKDVKCDGADLSHAYFQDAEDCSFRNATMEGAWLGEGNAKRMFRGCDFTGANLRKLTWTNRFSFVDCIFEKADLSEAHLEESKFSKANLARANLTAADLLSCDFSNANLQAAALNKARLVRAKLLDADLRKADLRDANLFGADLTGAKVDGADFTGANVLGAKINGVDVAKAKGLTTALQRAIGPVGPNIKELENIAKQSAAFSISAKIERKGQRTIAAYVSNRHTGAFAGGIREPGESVLDHEWDYRCRATTLPALLLELAQYCHGELILDAVDVMISKGPLRQKKVLPIAVAAWTEAFGNQVPQEEDREATRQQAREEFVGWLRKGEQGVKQWNAEKSRLVKAGHFKEVDLAGLDLTHIEFPSLDFAAANFAGATLEGANCITTSPSFKRACFRKASLGKEAYFTDCNFTEADLESAKMADARLWGSDFTRARLQKADLRRANFSGANLCGADFTGALVEKTEWEGAKFDEQTRFPKGFTPTPAMKWQGDGPHPGLPKIKKTAGPIDFDTFLKRLKESVDSAKLDKALKMLKAERFQLFSDVKADSVVGVVKSQTDKDLVYSCQLGADGTFACCTQNLNLCGGLNRQLCKHLLVLIVGLAKAARLDPTLADQWAQASRAEKPALNKDLMSETFLRYKGAEAGDVDWRPTETIPEDYYAL